MQSHSSRGSCAASSGSIAHAFQRRSFLEGGRGWMCASRYLSACRWLANSAVPPSAPRMRGHPKSAQMRNRRLATQAAVLSGMARSQMKRDAMSTTTIGG
eukprot:Lithocolla_globosa_v1_NODE_1968_length_2235_cov_8.159174.p4 type:complete len:100 gc:universal NODE_1968_length_2235_cov_8.159174:843-1142(+)